MQLMFQQYEERLSRRQAKASTLKNFRRTAVLFGESGLDPSAAEDWQIEEWLLGLPMSPRTRRLHFENLAAAYGYAVYRRQLERSPMEAVKLPRIPDKEPRILESEELRTLLGNCITDQQHLFISLLAYTGMRRDEIRKLRWEHVKPTTITVVAGKGDKLRHIPIHPALSEAIVSYQPAGEYVIPGRNDKPMSDSGLFTRLSKVQGDVECTFHDFRRTVASSLFTNGVDTLIIDKILGWAARTVGSRYYIKAADQSLQAAILRLYADDPLTEVGR